MAIDPGSGERADQQLRQQRGEGGQPEQGDRVGQPVDQPGQGDLLHPGAQRGNGVAAEVQAEIAMMQGTQGVGPATHGEVYPRREETVDNSFFVMLLTNCAALRALQPEWREFP